MSEYVYLLENSGTVDVLVFRSPEAVDTFIQKRYGFTVNDYLDNAETEGVWWFNDGIDWAVDDGMRMTRTEILG